MKKLDLWKNLDEKDIQDIINNYVEKKMSLKMAGEKYNLNGSQVRNLLKNKNIKQRRNCKDNRKYKINDDYFDTQSHNMAYILGFFAADGNVSSKENRLDLELASVDIDILEKIRAELQSERPIKTYVCSSGYTKNKLLFWSKKIKDVFYDYGIVPNKTYSKDFHFPYKLSNEYVIDYIRGFFDGDGSVNKTSGLSFELNSVNYLFLKDIQNFLSINYNIDTQITTCGMKGRNMELYRLYCYGNKARKIFDILYTKNSLYLKRKYDKWIELM